MNPGKSAKIAESIAIALLVPAMGSIFALLFSPEDQSIIYRIAVGLFVLLLLSTTLSIVVAVKSANMSILLEQERAHNKILIAQADVMSNANETLASISQSVTSQHQIDIDRLEDQLKNYANKLNEIQANTKFLFQEHNKNRSND